jgi:hypothetical protein
LPDAGAPLLLVAGGQLDPNIGRLLRRVLARAVPFRDLLVGPDTSPLLSYSFEGPIELDGRPCSPTACFVRHDVFLTQETGSESDHRAALNWFQAVKGWALSRPDVRFLNRHVRRADQGKFETLVQARSCGLRVPATMVANIAARAPGTDSVRKPVAGGELTVLLDRHETLAYPYLLQPRLLRPELRVYRIGARLLGFTIQSPHLDYREHHEVTVAEHPVPRRIGAAFKRLCDRLGLDFAAGDFMSNGKGGWTFLEANSQPMFAAFDLVAEGRLCDALIDWLVGERQ